ncbi:MAG: epoxyqueuosine reductase [bacterium]|nr:epoxyqueuosine reductase [bacterium]
MRINNAKVKAMARELGADLCGIASVDRFGEAPEGFHPHDVLPGCQTVIVLARRFLKSTLQAESTIPYTDIRNALSHQMDHMAIELSYRLEEMECTAVPINAIGPNEWDSKTNKSRGIISLKHSAQLAGLGKIGKNTLLVNETYGNMIWLSAVLLSTPLEPDPMASYDGCLPNCRICLDVCPIQALDGVSIDQKACWEYAFGAPERGGWRISCFQCRKVCPNCTGIRPGTRAVA